MRAWDYVDGGNFADLLRSASASFYGSFNRCDIAANDGGDKTSAGLLVRDQLDFGGLNHRVGGFDHRWIAFAFDHAECFGLTIFFCHVILLRSKIYFLR
jgi:hypothetical protein